MYILVDCSKNNRETEPSGMGWELFKNYLIAKEKFKPDFFFMKIINQLHRQLRMKSKTIRCLGWNIAYGR